MRGQMLSQSIIFHEYLLRIQIVLVVYVDYMIMDLYETLIIDFLSMRRIHHIPSISNQFCAEAIYTCTDVSV